MSGITKQAGVVDDDDGGWTVTDTRGETFKVKNIRRRPAAAIMVATYPSHQEHMFVGQKVSAVKGGRRAEMISKEMSLTKIKEMAIHHEKRFGATDVEIYLLGTE